MSKNLNVLLAGESWTSHTIHVKGFDSFTTSDYAEGGAWLINGLKRHGVEVTFLPNQDASRSFPDSQETLQDYDVVLLSDIGSNTLLLHPDTFVKSQQKADRCQLLREYVQNGGGLGMIGGYLSFSGIDGKARYQRTALRDVLPVEMLEGDDRVEAPHGVIPTISELDHPVFADISGEWPHFLGYNQLRPTTKSTVLATVGDDVFVAVGQFGRGRSAAFASDCGPHWGPPAFVEWEHYERFWSNLVHWLAQKPPQEGVIT
jgi:uncharacterized membrane protein